VKVERGRSESTAPRKVCSRRSSIRRASKSALNAQALALCSVAGPTSGSREPTQQHRQHAGAAILIARQSSVTPKLLPQRSRIIVGGEQEGYTSEERLAVESGSAGGLTIGASLNMKPGLFKVGCWSRC